MAKYLLAIDQGTTGSTALLVTPSGETIARATTEFPQHFPQSGWVEHDTDQIRSSIESSVRQALVEAGARGEEILAIGITNQRETTVVWDRKSGRPIHRAIVWQCRRTADACRALAEAGHADLFRKRTGLVLDAYFSGTKIAWILDHVQDARKRAEAGELAFGTIDSWLVHELTGGAVHVTDVTNASRTLLFDIRRLAWDAELAALLNVPMNMLPKAVGSAEIVGVTNGLSFLPDGIPIAGIAGDQQAALFGQACFEAGDAKCTYGTGAFVLVNTGGDAPVSENGLVTTIAWKIGDKTTWALEGSAFIAGAAVQWLRDGIGMIGSAAEVEALAATVDDAAGVAFVPALAGLGAPHWDPNARGALVGLTRGTTRAHIARAVLEGIAFSVDDLLGAMAKDAKRTLSSLKVDGGAARNDLLMQFQANLSDVVVERPTELESTARGAAMLAAIGAKLVDGDGAAALWKRDRSFRPEFAAETRASKRERWARAVAAARLG